MCGIFGYTGAPTEAAGLVFAGLKELEYRGYDSWGIAVGAEGCVHMARDVGKLSMPPDGLPASGLAIGHTRWATTGAVTIQNAHPHRDCGGRLALVHNGIIENHVALRAGLLKRGHHFRSQTDSEVAVHLLEEELTALSPGEGGLAEALRRVSLRLDGLNALAALDATSGELAAVKNGSPLTVGLGDGAHYLASDMAALLPYTHRLVFVRDNQAVALRPDGVSLYDAATGAALPLAVEEVSWQSGDAELQGYHHYLEKEIWEQPDLLRHIATDGLEQANALARFVAESGTLHFVACGTAYHAALLGRYLLALEARCAATATHAHEFGAVAPLLEPGDALVALSQSGETIDVLDAVRAAQARGARTAALVNVPGSTLSRAVDLCLMLGAGPEKCVLSTKTFTAKLAYLLLTAGALSGHPERLVAALREAADDVESLRLDGRLRVVLDVAHHIMDRERLFVLGRGPGYPLALEAALKIKEVTYIHAEGFPSGELKHGVIALIEPGTPVLIFAPTGTDEAHLLSSAGEVKARGAYIVGIGPHAHEVFDAHIPIRAGGLAYYPAALVPVQRLAYELALLRGADPDKPRNLAKSVTVR